MFKSIITIPMKSGYRDAMIKKIRSKQAVSEVIGVVLLLGITVALFALLNFYVFHFSFEPSVTSVNLIGTIDKSNNMIYIEHTSGESLEGNTEIIITIGDDPPYQSSVSEIINKVDMVHWTLIVPISNADKNPDKWDFGETVQFHYEPDITGKYIRADVVNPVKNTMILSVVLQQESS